MNSVRNSGPYERAELEDVIKFAEKGVPISNIRLLRSWLFYKGIPQYRELSTRILLTLKQLKWSGDDLIQLIDYLRYKVMPPLSPEDISRLKWFVENNSVWDKKTFEEIFAEDKINSLNSGQLMSFFNEKSFTLMARDFFAEQYARCADTRVEALLNRLFKKGKTKDDVIFNEYVARRLIWCCADNRIISPEYRCSVSKIMDYLLDNQIESVMMAIDTFADVCPRALLSAISNDAFSLRAIEAHKDKLKKVVFNPVELESADLEPFGNNNNLYDCCMYFAENLPF